MWKGTGVKPEEITRYVGQWVTVQLSSKARCGPAVTGRLVGTLDAADGLVVHIEPEGSKGGGLLTLHYHHIVSIMPGPSGS